jgi:hypothetical protein
VYRKEGRKEDELMKERENEKKKEKCYRKKRLKAK